MPTEVGMLRQTWHGSANEASGSRLMISMGWAKKAMDVHCVVFLSMLVAIVTSSDVLS
jgi:hypothetical protein